MPVESHAPQRVAVESPLFDLEDCVDRFERAWRSAVPRIADFLPSSPDERRMAAMELTMVDLELRRRTRGRGETAPRLEFYVKHLPELGPWDELPAVLVAEEFRVRLRFGEGPTRADYRARFARHGALLEAALDQVEAEAAAEGVDPATVAQPSRQALDPEDGKAAPEESDLELPGVPLLDYRQFVLRRQIGAGGMSRVYTALMRSREQPLAIKILKQRLAADRTAAARFRLEAKLTALAAAAHPSVVRLLGIGSLPRQGRFLALELIVGEDLGRIRARGPLDPHEAARLVAAAADIMSYVHRAGVVHCDLKPGNLLRETTGRLVVSDFGLARAHPVESSDLAGSVAGTPAFMAPEQRDEAWRPHPSADVYALGRVLQALCDPPARLARLVEQALLDSPRERPTMRQLHADLTDWL